MILGKNKLGLIVGVLFGVCHLGWALLVAFGFAQRLMDWIFRLHFVQPPYLITPFDPGVAVMLIVVTTLTGYVTGWLFAAIWNLLQPRERTQIRARHVPVGV